MSTDRANAVLFFATIACLMLLLSALRLSLLVYNFELVSEIPNSEILGSMRTGLWFDLSATAYAVLPFPLLFLSNSIRLRYLCLAWAGFFSSLFLFCGLMELEFYAEFQQRLNSLVIVYMAQDPATVLSMLWNGYPVVWLSSMWILSTIAGICILLRLGKFTRPVAKGRSSRLHQVSTCIALFVLVIGMGRGSLSSGSPLRWGDAYKFDHNFANHLALNGTKTFIKSIVSELHNDDRDQWLAAIPNAVALDHVRKQIVLPGEQLVDVATAPIRRITTSKPRLENAVDNIVIILLESFSGQFIGALGNTRNVTPYFDELSKKGVLFTRFFSNGSHTHQGIFATLSCFPNLPGYEYLMQQPQGRNQFSGITAILGPDLVEDLFIYNGDFRWDNQAGFFKNQGMDHFIGCQDFVSPMLMSDTWGVSDEDMFIRATHELRRLFTGRPFFVVLQTLTNHPPYTLPDPLPFEAVMDDGERSERLTAMKYSDWALGKFFESIENDSFFDHTVFAILGDHGFGTDRQLTDINLLRFHVPLLIIAPNIHESYGNRNTTVGSQVDVIPTLVSMVSGRFQHQCWGRNLFAVPESQGGFAIIKPSGGEPIVAILRDDKILTYDHERESQLFTYGLNQSGTVAPLIDRQIEQDMKTDLLSYIQTSMQSLVFNTTSPYE